MSIPIRAHHDFGGVAQLLDLTVETLAADPGSARNGRIVYNTATNKFRVAENAAWVSYLTTTTRLDQIAAPTAAVALNGQKITGLADGTAAQDAVTKNQLDALAAGIDVHPSVRAASTGNVTVASPGASIDGVSLSAGDRVLLKNQTTTTENGLWVWNGAAAAMTRATDADTAGELSGGSHVFVEEGTTQADTGWVITTNGSITPGTTAHTWTQFTGIGSTLGGNGLTQTGNVLDVNVDSSSIEINADILRVKALGITNAMLAGSIDLTTKVTGSLPIANGGTAGTTAATARANLGAVGKFAADITGNGSLTAFTVNHALGTTDVQVEVWEASTNLKTFVDVTRVDANNVSIGFAVAPIAAKVYRVVVVG